MSTALSPSGERLAFIENGGNRGRDTRVLHVASTPRPSSGAAPRVVDVRVDGYRLFSMTGWVDDDHVVVQAVRGDSGRFLYASVSLDTGQVVELVPELRAERTSSLGTWASGLWQRPTVDRPEPGWHLNPRLPFGALMLALAIAAWVYVERLVARRRRRRREAAA